MSPSELRRDYRLAALDPTDVSADPLIQFRSWFGDAQSAGLLDPNAMTLATATPDGRPSARVVLLKTIDERGFGFFTDYRSRKAQELDANPRAALSFSWLELERQDLRLKRLQKAVTGRNQLDSELLKSNYFERIHECNENDLPLVY